MVRNAVIPAEVGIRDRNFIGEGGLPLSREWRTSVLSVHSGIDDHAPRYRMELTRPTIPTHDAPASLRIVANKVLLIIVAYENPIPADLIEKTVLYDNKGQLGQRGPLIQQLSEERTLWRGLPPKKIDAENHILRSP